MGVYIIMALLYKPLIEQKGSAQAVSSIAQSGDAGMTLLKFATDNGVAVAVLCFLAWVFTTRLWPFYTDKYFPAAAARESARDNIQGTIVLALTELKGLTGQLVRMFEGYEAGQNRIERAVLHIVPPRVSPSGEKEASGGEA